jgi:Zn-dependent protease with chaperone function
MIHALLLSAVVLAGAAPAPDPAAALRGYLGRDMVFVEDAAVKEYLGSIAAKLLATQPGAPPVPTILLRSTGEFSLFTDTRGNIVVGTEVLRQVESEDELAAALGHELAHVIHADAQQKDVMQDIPFTVESASVIAAALDAKGGAAAPGQQGQAAPGRTQDVGAVWADLLAPSWNRDQERAADLASADMAKAAGYDTAAFGTLFSKLQAANAVRSARVEAVRQAALAKVQAVQPASGGVANQAMAGVKSSAGSYAVETAFASLSGFGADYDTPEQRAEAVQAHLQPVAAARRDKTARSPRFRQVLRDGPAGAMLAADKAGLDVMAALAAGERMQAMMHSPALLKAASGGEPASPHLDLALGSWYDAAGQRDLAEQRAVAWTATPLATRSGYLWRASYQAARGEYDAALATMDLGAGRLGDRSLFLPQMVAMNRQKGDTKTAERLTLDCAKADTKASLGTATKLAQGGLEPSGGLYAECTAALGYDPIAKTQKQAIDAASELKNKGAGLKGLFDSLTKGTPKP